MVVKIWIIQRISLVFVPANSLSENNRPVGPMVRWPPCGGYYDRWFVLGSKSLCPCDGERSEASRTLVATECSHSLYYTPVSDCTTNHQVLSPVSTTLTDRNQNKSWPRVSVHDQLKIDQTQSLLQLYPQKKQFSEEKRVPEHQVTHFKGIASKYLVSGSPWEGPLLKDFLVSVFWFHLELKKKIISA